MSNNNKKDEKKPIDSSEEKVEIAQYIADKSQKISKRTEALANGTMRVLRWMSDWFDRFLYNPRHSKLVAFAVALVVYLGFNSQGIMTAPLEYTKPDVVVPVSVTYNAEMYELKGVDEEVKVTFIGSQSDIGLLNVNSALKVELDLSGLTEGTHQVKYKIDGVSPRIKTMIEPSTANVKIMTKEAEKKELSSDFINMDKLNPKYVLGEPELELREVSIRGSRETLDQVAFVKALIDVSGQTQNFETDAQIVAYNQKGEKLDKVDIIPQTVKAKVAVNETYKSVPIRPIFEGDMPAGKAVSQWKMDAESITIYAPKEILDNIDEVRVPIPTSALTSDTNKLSQTVSLPAGVRHGTVTKVNIEVQLGPVVSQKVDNVEILFTSNVNDLKPSVNGLDQAVISLEVFSTEENIKEFKRENLRVYIDLRNAVVGDGQQLPLFIEYNYPKSGVVYRIVPEKETITVDIIK